MTETAARAAMPDREPEMARLRAQVVSLQDAVRARDDFIAIAAHELRNPMTPILGVAELALAAAYQAVPPCPPRVTGLLERLHDLVGDFIKRATSLLDMSRIEAGNLRLHFAMIDVSALTRAVAVKYELAAVHARSLLELEIEEGVTGLLDALAVEQTVDNLLSNALKFGSGAPVTLRLRSTPQQAVLEVQDRGIGLSAEQQTRIFARFEQVMTQHRGSGFGIGLWVASRLVAAMGGRITVASRPDEGATFSVTLPLAPEEADQAMRVDV